MKSYEIEALCQVKKRVIVDAKNKEKAIEEFERGNWIDEIEVEMSDWEMIEEPQEII